MTTLTLSKDVVYKDGSKTTITVEADDTGCTVKCFSTIEKLEWHVVLDPAQLAEVFEDVAVRHFRVIVELLAKAWAATEAIK